MIKNWFLATAAAPTGRSGSQVPAGRSRRHVSPRLRPSSRVKSPDVNPRNEPMATIERREAVDGCGCVRCRDVEPAVVRRTTGDDVHWSLRLLRRHPSNLALIAGLVCLVAALEPLTAPFEPTTGPASWIGDPVHTAVGIVLLVVFLRGYVGAVVATELTGGRQGVRRALPQVGRRFVPLLATVVGMLVVAALAFAAALVVVSLLVFEVGLLGPGVFDGLTPTLLFGSVIALVLYKLWLAPEVCVVGGAGPIRALRASWGITSAHWRRVCVLLGSFAVTISAPHVVGGLLVAVGGQPIQVPGFGVLSDLFRWLSTAVWYCVGAQIYVRSTFE